MQKSKPTPVLFISHGFVPLYFDHNMSPQFLGNLKLMGEYVQKYYDVKNIIAISANSCLQNSFSINSSKTLKNSHDHPFEKYYSYDKPLKGNPELSTLLVNLFRAYEIESQADPSGSIDSGVWAPLKEMFPSSDLSVATISVNQNFDGQLHLNLGKLLQEYRYKGSLIISFGGITQNIHQFYEALVDEKKVKNAIIYSQFEGWCKKVIEKFKGEERFEKILEFKKHPHFQQVHPTSEHFMPLIIAIGAAGNSTGRSFHSQIFKKCMSLSCYIFEDTEIIQLSQ